MDIATITADSRPIKITDPRTGKETGFVIHLRPISSPEVKAVKRQFTNEALRNKRSHTTAEKLETNSILLLTAAIARWEWLNDADGNPSSIGGAQLDLTEKNAKAILKIDWIRAQIDEELGDDAAFFRSAD